MFYGKKYYTRTEFKQIKNKNTVIVGYTSKEKWEAGKHRTLEKLDYENSIYYVRPFIFGVTTGYIEVNDNEFIKVREHSLLMILILLLITGCMVLMGNFFLKELLAENLDPEIRKMFKEKQFEELRDARQFLTG